MNYQSVVKQSSRGIYLVLVVVLLILAGLSVNKDAEDKTAVEHPVLVGLWESNCYSFEDGVFQIRTFEFVLSHLVTVNTRSYDSSDCSGSVMGVSELSATWDMGHHLFTREGEPVYQLDVLMRDPDKDLIVIRQIVHVNENQMVLGITSHDLQTYPEELDWEVIYTLSHSG